MNWINLLYIAAGLLVAPSMFMVAGESFAAGVRGRGIAWTLFGFGHLMLGAAGLIGLVLGTV